MTGFVYDKHFKAHDPGTGHPECPQRLDAVIAALKEHKLLERVKQLPFEPATVKDISRCHGADYIAQAEREVNAGYSTLTTGDTNVCPASYDVCMAATGGIMAAIDAVVAGSVNNAFCAVRPPGHHACKNRGMGFCVFNCIAVAARYAQAQHAIERVLIIDWDVHHGNGTQDIFYDDPSVFYFSTHQWPHYPFTGHPGETGSDKGVGRTLNCPLPAGVGRDEVMAAFVEQLLPAMAEFKPQLILVSAGFDSRENDPLGGFLLTDPDFVELTQLVLELADTHAGGRLVSVLEGGYNLSGLGLAAASHVRALLEYKQTSP